VSAVAAALALGGLVAAAAWLRRRGTASDPAPLALRARQPLGKDSGVAVVAFAGRELLVGYGAAGVTLVAAAAAGEERP
jgi:hypothetical protein